MQKKITKKTVTSTENHSACAFYKNINYAFSEGFGSLKNSLKWMDQLNLLGDC